MAEKPTTNGSKASRPVSRPQQHTEIVIKGAREHNL